MNENARVSEKRNEYSEHEIDEEDPAIDDDMVKFVDTEQRWGRDLLSDFGISLKSSANPNSSSNSIQTQNFTIHPDPIFTKTNFTKLTSQISP